MQIESLPIIMSKGAFLLLIEKKKFKNLVGPLSSQ